MDSFDNIALRYLHGDGVPLNPQLAAEWLRKAGEQGHVEAVGELGTLYRFGNGVEQNFAAALRVTAGQAAETRWWGMGASENR